MKSILLFFCTGILLLGASCEKKLARYEIEQDRLNFIVTERDEINPSILRKTFVFDPVNTVRDTVYVPVETMGFIRDYDRHFKVKQVLENADSTYNAEPGVHYVGFDDPEVSGQLVIPAGEMAGQIPVIALRDKTMRDTVTILHLQIIPCDDFLPGDPDRIDQIVEIGDQLMEPKRGFDSFFGVYGVVKHRFLIEHFDMNFDDATMEIFLADVAYGRAINARAKNLLAEENAEREARGEGPLMERDGKTKVSFP